jgi:U6 snRNA-associated Sm-like protein LSm7
MLKNTYVVCSRKVEGCLIVDPDDGSLLDTTRSLGLVVCRGPTIVLISPTDGVEEIENPFAASE